MEPHWLMIVSWIVLGLGFASALVILVDEVLLGYRQHMAIMNLVHPISALYWGPVWIWAYFTRGRRSSHKSLHHEAQRLIEENADTDQLKQEGESTDAKDVRPWHVSNADSHCGAGCTLGDIGGEWLLFAIGAPALAAIGIYGWEIIVDFVLAWTLGIGFQYFTIVPMRDDIGRLAGVGQAIKVDTLSIVAFQIGLFGWMAISHFVLFQPPLPIDTASHWFMMQVGMILGFFTAWPVNRLLVRRGIKEKMDYRKHLVMPLRPRRRAVDAKRDVSQPLGRAQRRPSRHRRQAPASPCSRRPQPDLREDGAHRRPG